MKMVMKRVCFIVLTIFIVKALDAASCTSGSMPNDQYAAFVNLTSQGDASYRSQNYTQSVSFYSQALKISESFCQYNNAVTPQGGGSLTAPVYEKLGDAYQQLFLKNQTLENAKNVDVTYLNALVADNGIDPAGLQNRMLKQNISCLQVVNAFNQNKNYADAANYVLSTYAIFIIIGNVFLNSAKAYAATGGNVDSFVKNMDAVYQQIIILFGKLSPDIVLQYSAVVAMQKRFLDLISKTLDSYLLLSTFQPSLVNFNILESLMAFVMKIPQSIGVTTIDNLLNKNITKVDMNAITSNLANLKPLADKLAKIYKKTQDYWATFSDYSEDDTYHGSAYKGSQKGYTAWNSFDVKLQVILGMSLAISSHIKDIAQAESAAATYVMATTSYNPINDAIFYKNFNDLANFCLERIAVIDLVYKPLYSIFNVQDASIFQQQGVSNPLDLFEDNFNVVISYCKQIMNVAGGKAVPATKMPMQQKYTDLNNNAFNNINALETYHSQINPEIPLTDPS